MNDDTISRQAAIDECYPITVDGEVYEVVQIETLMGLPSAQPEHATCYLDSPCEYQNTNIALPSAQPMRKKGKWIDMGDFEQCSACTGTHLKEINTVYGKAIWIKMSFCPNCGADMRGEGDEVD